MKDKGVNFILAAISVLILTLVLVGCGQSKAPAAEPKDKVYTIKVGIGHPNTHPFYLGMEKFKQVAETESKGRIKVDLYPNSQLGGEREMQESVSLGNLDITMGGLLSIYEPLFAILDLPYQFRDREHIKKFHDSKVFDELAKPLIAKNIRVLTYFEGGFRQVTNNKKPINTVEDLKGLKMRTPEIPGIIETFKQFGCVVSPMSSKELYGALQQGVVDGQENPFQNIYSNKFFEVQKHLAVTNHIYNNGYVFMNNKLFNSLPQDLQQIVMKAAKEGQTLQLAIAAKADKDMLEELKKKGMLVTTPNQEEFRKAALPVYEIFFAKYGDKSRKLAEDIKNIK